MKYLFDTSVIIDLLRKKERAFQIVKKCAAEYRPSISFLTLTEIAAGLRPEFKKDTLNLLGTFEQIPVTAEAAWLAGELIFAHARKGKKIHFEDAILAATCMQKNLVLVTGNVKDFRNIKGLSLLRSP